MKRLFLCGTLVLAATTLCLCAHAQSDTSAAELRHLQEGCTAGSTTVSLRTYPLKNVTLPNDGNEIQTALRNLLPPTTRIFFVASEDTIYVCGTPELQTMVERVVRELDKPRPAFRLTYAITENDSGKRVGTQHYTFSVTSGQRMQVKEGSRVPIATGSYSSGSTSAAVQTQFQYIDVGMNFDVTLTDIAGAAVLKSKVEQSSVVYPSAPGQPADTSHPVVRQVSFEGSPTVPLGKPTMLSSLDVPESTRHVDIEVLVEEIK